MKNKMLILVIILMVIASIIVFEPLPAKAIDYCDFSRAPTCVYLFDSSKQTTSAFLSFGDRSWNYNPTFTKNLYVNIPVDQRDVSLTLQNYNCNTHIATFFVSSIGCNVTDFAIVSTQKDMEKEYVVSYTYDKTNKLLKVYFTPDLPIGNVSLYLGITIDQNLTLLKDITFINTCNVRQIIQLGKLYITSLPTEVKKDSPQVGSDYYDISFSFAYGGNIIHDFGSSWGLSNTLGRNIFISSVKVNGGIGYSIIGISSSGISIIFQDGSTYNISSSISWTYDSNNNISYLTIDVPLIKSYQPDMKSDIAISFNLSGNGLSVNSENSVHIIIGEPINSTGNPILDFLIKTWNKFKDWFVNTIKFLFVPDSSDISDISA
jgi:hypothetical protein